MKQLLCEKKAYHSKEPGGKLQNHIKNMQMYTDSCWVDVEKANHWYFFDKPTNSIVNKTTTKKANHLYQLAYLSLFFSLTQEISEGKVYKTKYKL